MDNQLWQYDHDFLEANIPRSIRAGVRRVIGGSRLALDLWDRTKPAYTDDYIAFVDDAVADLRTQVP